MSVQESEQVKETALDESLSDTVQNLIAEADVLALDQLLNTTTGETYRQLHSYLQTHAQDLADVYGFSLQVGDFMFEELVYLLEREKMEVLVDSIVANNDHLALEEYFEGTEKGLRAPMLVFELLCNGQYQKNWPLVSQWLYYSFLRLAEPREPALLLGMIKEAYPERGFWKLFAQQVANGLDVDFLYLTQSAEAVLLLEKENYYSILTLLNERQKTVLFVQWLPELDFMQIWNDFPSLVQAAFAENYLRWLEQIESDSLALVAPLVVQETVDWDVLLNLDLSKEFWQAISEALKESKRNMDQAFYQEVSRRVHALL